MSHDPAPKSQRHSLKKHSNGLLLVLSVGMIAGVLIWAKLRLVTDIPRSAYADPREVETPEDQSSDQTQSPIEQSLIEDDEVESEDSELSDSARDELPTP